MRNTLFIGALAIAKLAGSVQEIRAANAPIGWAVNAIGTLTIVRSGRRPGSYRGARP